MIPQLRFDVPWSPIQGFVGANGGGKSALCIDTAISQAERFDVPLWSNVWIDPERTTAKVHRLRGLLDLMNVREGIVVMDDIASVAPARETNASPPELVMELAALRHRDAMLMWSAPVLEDVDVKIRRVTQSVVALKPLRRKRIEGQLWPNTVLSYAKAYDFTPVDTVTINADTPRKQHGFLRLASLRLDAYNTRETMQLTADHAVCTVCGLRKRREYCNGKHPHPVAAPDPLDATPDALDIAAAPDHDPVPSPPPTTPGLRLPRHVRSIGSRVRNDPANDDAG